jgi:hypothetical protein
MTSSLRPRNIQGDRITVQDVETETLIYDVRSHKAWCLNRSSASIWRLCDGQHTVAQIAALAAVNLGSPVSEDLVLLTLEELREKDLLEPQTAVLLPAGFLPQDLSRRQMIGRAGLAAAALLPVIAALTAPPASAQSGSTGTGDSVSGGYKEP